MRRNNRAASRMLDPDWFRSISDPDFCIILCNRVKQKALLLTGRYVTSLAKLCFLVSEWRHESGTLLVSGRNSSSRCPMEIKDRGLEKCIFLRWLDPCSFFLFLLYVYFIFGVQTKPVSFLNKISFYFVFVSFCLLCYYSSDFNIILFIGNEYKLNDILLFRQLEQ